jgi:hypothetical protein
MSVQHIPSRLIRQFGKWNFETPCLLLWPQFRFLLSDPEFCADARVSERKSAGGKGDRKHQYAVSVQVSEVSAVAS